MSKRYDQYCPIAHALELVGERWSLLIVRELLHGPKRYTDLAANLPGIGTNILAARLKDLEAGSVLVKRKLPPPAASQVYELTAFGNALRPVMRELAYWGLLSLGPPRPDELAEGWLVNALDLVLSRGARGGRLEFRIEGEVASLVEGEARPGSIESPDVLVEADVTAFYYLFAEGNWDGVTVEGDRSLLEQLLNGAREPLAGLASVSAAA